MRFNIFVGKSWTLRVQKTLNPSVRTDGQIMCVENMKKALIFAVLI